MSLKIISCNYIGKQQTYNLTMEGKNHNYILDANIASANSHAISYSVISYQTAFLKTYHKAKFFCALLDNSIKDQEDLIKYTYMCRENGVSIVPPDVNNSSAGFTLDNGTIIFGLAGVKGLGEKASKDIIDKRPEDGFKSIEHMVELGIRKNHIGALAKCGALEEISELSREVLIANLDTLIEYFKKQIKYKARLEKIEENNRLIEIWETNPEGPKPRRAAKVSEKHIPVYPELIEPTREDVNRLTFERQTLGFYLTGHPMDSYPGLVGNAAFTIEELKQGDIDSSILNQKTITIPAVISSVNKIRTKAGKNMASLIIEDKTGRIEATMFPKQWTKLEDTIKEDTVCLIKGGIRISQIDDDSPPIVKVIVTDIVQIEEDNGTVVKPFSIVLDDKTMVEFIPPPNQNISAWQQALAIAENVRRMR